MNPRRPRASERHLPWARCNRCHSTASTIVSRTGEAPGLRQRRWIRSGSARASEGGNSVIATGRRTHRRVRLIRVPLDQCRFVKRRTEGANPETVANETSGEHCAFGWIPLRRGACRLAGRRPDPMRRPGVTEAMRWKPLRSTIAGALQVRTSPPGDDVEDAAVRLRRVPRGNQR